MFDIDFRYIITVLLPTRLRQARIVAWLEVILFFFKQIYFDFKVFRFDRLYDINFTGQTMYLQHKLRDTFGCTGLYIADGDRSFPLYISNVSEGKLPAYMGNTFVLGAIYNTAEVVLYNNYWYTYIAIGNGSNPNTDSNAIQGLSYEPFIFNRNESLTSGSFIIYIPNACYLAMTVDEKNLLKFIVEFYILADKTYKIIVF